MIRYFVLLAAMFLFLQIEIVALLWLDGQNLRVWHSQAQLNRSFIDILSNQCNLWAMPSTK